MICDGRSDYQIRAPPPSQHIFKIFVQCFINC